MSPVYSANVSDTEIVVEVHTKQCYACLGALRHLTQSEIRPINFKLNPNIQTIESSVSTCISNPLHVPSITSDEITRYLVVVKFYRPL